MTDLRIGVIGYGMRGTIARTAHRPGRGSTVAAVADPDPGPVRRRPRPSPTRSSPATTER